MQLEGFGSGGQQNGPLSFASVAASTALDPSGLEPSGTSVEASAPDELVEHAAALEATTATSKTQRSFRMAPLYASASASTTSVSTPHKGATKGTLMES